jgi:ribosomal-protein-alanine N-acetyltransferase
VRALYHVGTKTIETNRLRLRKYEMRDAEDMFSNWVTDLEVSRYWGWKPHENIEETKSLLASWIDEYSNIDNYHWVIVLKESTQAVGYIYLNEIDTEIESVSVHYLVSRKYWGKGIMTEACKAVIDFAFSTINVLYIHSHHHLDNPASGKVMQKSGMRYIETKYRHIPDCEQISGVYCYYGITKDEWLRIV